MVSGLTRRGFLKVGVFSGIAVRIGFIGAPARSDVITEARDSQPAWATPEGHPRFRIDAVAKVTGDKSFSRDYRARDMPGWPAAQSHAFLIRGTRADHAFAGLDLGRLGEDLQPDRLVLGDDLVRDGLAPPDGDMVPGPDFYGDMFLVPRGRTPRFLGQPVGLLIYHDFARFDAARRRLRFADDVVRWGAQTGPDTPANYSASRFVRIGGNTPDDPDPYSPLEGTTVYAGFKGDTVQWPPPARDGDAAGRAMWAAGQIEAEIAAAGADRLVLKRSYMSQSTDASAMEADNGNVWYDPASGIMRAVIATQSAYEVASVTPEMVAKSRFALKQFDLSIGYTVGYGTKDHSIYPFLAVVAGLYGEGRPVRLANDRYAQFQMGIKRHAFRSDLTLVVDKASGRFEILTGAYRSDGGGRRNFSPEVGTVAAAAGQSIYYLPKSDFSVAVHASRAVDAGSTRGYGTLQSMTATELLVDEAAELLGMDPIELRLKNVLRSGMKNSQGAVPAGSVRADELLEKIRTHTLWRERAASKLAYERAHPGWRYGVGFAQVQKDFGTGAEAAITTLAFDAKGRLAMRQNGNDMGTGMTTSHPVMVAREIGRLPQETAYGVTSWPEMPLVTADQPYTMPQAEETELARNPHWTPTFLSPMSASNSVYFVGHATRAAARALLRLSLWPAALAIWSQGGGGGQFASLAVAFEDARIVQGRLTAAGLEPLSFERLAEAAHRLGLVTGVSVHTFNRWQWAQATFDVPTVGMTTFPVDALSVRYGDGAPPERRALMTDGGFHFIARNAVTYPPVQRNNAAVTYYSGMATLAEVAVDTASGKVRVLSHHSVLECGNQIVPELVSGQIQGGLAMGIGHALLEHLPLYEDGPGNGTWNWNRYLLPHAEDVAVWTQTAEVLPPLSETDPPKGMAEVVMIAIVPAILNGITHAIGTRFRETPVTADKILEALA
ncbi:xanthine dehydrogenase family protein molybdopterin-binding subunit [Azorhizobium doebereinerae]|uniref:xanthine dehydrogenase family protein molybdopterin-binding subunit n=1 Tax=Azorhizobium doebereinerae TaxID=281091 RepID=UPI00048E73B0|nr:molybdopterin cofactor-binding domain-containing protein [Azorhizobium doebereinerae]